MGPSGPIFFCKIKGPSQFSFETAPFLPFIQLQKSDQKSTSVS